MRKILKAAWYASAIFGWIITACRLYETIATAAPLDRFYTLGACFACIYVAIDILIYALPDPEKESA